MSWILFPDVHQSKKTDLAYCRLLLLLFSQRVPLLRNLICLLLYYVLFVFHSAATLSGTDCLLMPTACPSKQWTMWLRGSVIVSFGKWCLNLRNCHSAGLSALQHLHVTKDDKEKYIRQKFWGRKHLADEIQVETARLVKANRKVASAKMSGAKLNKKSFWQLVESMPWRIPSIL